MLNRIKSRVRRDAPAFSKRPAIRNETRYVLAERSGAGSYMIALGHLVSGAFDPNRFNAACQALLLRHAALRTHFQIRGRVVEALVSDQPVVNFEAAHSSDPSLEAFRAWAVPLVFDDVDPTKPGSLIRFFVADYGDSWRFTIAGHHAITDGISRGVMNRELLKLYAGLVLDPLRVSGDVSSPEAPNADCEVSRLVDALPDQARVFADVEDPEQRADAGVFVEHSFSNLSKSVKRLSRVCEGTRFNTLSAAYAAALKAATGSSEISTFFQSEGRKRFGVSNALVGPYSNTLPLDLSFDPDASFKALVQELNQRTHKVLELESLPVLECAIEHHKQPSVSINYFPPAPRIAIDGLDVGPREFLDRRTEYDLNLVWSEEGGKLNGKLFYNPNRISKRRAQHILSLQAAIVEAAFEQPDQSCRALLKTVRCEIGAEPGHVAPDPSPGRALHDAFFQHAATAPDDIAIESADARISYGALAEGALRYARSLQAAGVTREVPVAILAERGPDLVTAMLGVSAAGGAFAVIDSAYPRERIRQMLDQLGANVAMRADGGRSDFSDDTLTWVTPATASITAASASVAPRLIAYYLFTSGSTGQPKLISHPESTLQRFTAWQVAETGIERPVTLMVAGLSHDPLLRDIFLPLSHGGTIAIPGADDLASPCQLRRLIESARVSVLHLTPSMGTLIGIGAPSWSVSNVKAIFWGGARLKRDLVKDWHTRADGAQQFNLYGATETPQAAMIYRVDPEHVRDPIPLGRDLPWTRARLVDSSSDDVGAFEMGEILIEMTDPVGGARGADGETVKASSLAHYTGDLGYAAADGTIHFLGRGDAQLNLNGHRIEPAEIEAAAESVPGIAQACLLVSDGDTPDLWLFAADNGAGVSRAQISQAIGARLPSHMVPKHVAIVEFLPLTANGKIDREALRVSMNSLNHDRPKAPPTTADERYVADLLSKYTGQSSPSRDDSLVDLGADSLSVLEARFALEEHGYDLPQNWEFLPIAALSEKRTAPQREASLLMSLFKLHRMDTFIVLRCLAIVLIVMLHAGVPMPTGASVMLFALAGFALGKVQMPAVLNDGKTGRIWSMVVKLSIPLAAVSVFLYAQNALRGIPPHPAMILPIENMASFIDEVILQRSSYERREVWLWFLHVYLQMFVIIGALLAIPKLFRWLRADHWRGAIAFYAVSNAMMASAFAIAIAVSPDTRGSVELWEQFPTAIFPFLAIGCVFALANTRPRKQVAISLAVLQYCAFWLVYQVHSEPLWIGGLLLTLLLVDIRLPRALSVIVASVSTQALMIYLTHWTTLAVLTRIADPFLPKALQIAIAIAVGVAVGRAFRPVLNAIGVNRLAESKITFNPRLRSKRT